MDERNRAERVRDIASAVAWTQFPDPLGRRIDITESLVRIALDQRHPGDERFYCSDLGNVISLQGSMGEITLPAVRVVNQLLALGLCVKPDLMYELLEVLSSSWTETEMTDPSTGRRVVLWEAVFKELYQHKNLYLEDLHRLQPSECPALLGLLWLLSTKYPEIIDHMRQKADVVEERDREVLYEKISQALEAIDEDRLDHDYRYDVDP